MSNQHLSEFTQGSVSDYNRLPLVKDHLWFCKPDSWLCNCFATSQGVLVPKSLGPKRAGSTKILGPVQGCSVWRMYSGYLTEELLQTAPTYVLVTGPHWSYASLLVAIWAPDIKLLFRKLCQCWVPWPLLVKPTHKHVYLPEVAWHRATERASANLWGTLLAEFTSLVPLFPGLLVKMLLSLLWETLEQSRLDKGPLLLY